MTDDTTELEPFGYHFGCPSMLKREFARVMPSIQGTFDAQRGLWNRLCEIEADNRIRYRAIVESGSEDAARITAEIAALSDKIAAALAIPAKQRDRKKIAEWRMELNAAKMTARMIRKTAAGAQKPQLDALEQERRDAVKAAVQGAGLWWCHSEVITERYDVARVRAMKTNSELRPVPDGSRAAEAFGTLRVRWQNGLPLHVLREGDSLARLMPGGRRERECTLKFCIESEYREKDYVELPIRLGRDIPEGSLVRNITLFRRRIGDQLRWQGSICVKQPIETPALGADKDLARVLLTPAWLTDDERFTRRLEHVRFLQAALDKKAVEFSGTTTDLDLRVILEREMERRDGRGIVYGDIRRFGGGSAEAQEFLARHWRMWSEMNHLRDKAMRDRDNRYCHLAKELANKHTRIEVEKPMMAFTSKTHDRPAWGRFCEILARSGRKHGCEVVFFKPERKECVSDQEAAE